MGFDRCVTRFVEKTKTPGGGLLVPSGEHNALATASTCTHRASRVGCSANAAHLQSCSLRPRSVCGNVHIPKQKSHQTVLHLRHDEWRSLVASKSAGWGQPWRTRFYTLRFQPFSQAAKMHRRQQILRCKLLPPGPSSCKQRISGFTSPHLRRQKMLIGNTRLFRASTELPGFREMLGKAQQK